MLFNLYAVKFYNNCNNILPVYLQPKENPRIQMPNGSELSFSLDGSFWWMVVFFRWKSMTIEQFTDP